MCLAEHEEDAGSCFNARLANPIGLAQANKTTINAWSFILESTTSIDQTPDQSTVKPSRLYPALDRVLCALSTHALSASCGFGSSRMTEAPIAESTSEQRGFWETGRGSRRRSPRQERNSECDSTEDIRPSSWLDIAPPLPPPGARREMLHIS